MKSVILLLILCVSGGALLVDRRREKSGWGADAVQYRAAAHLPANHRIVNSDLVPPPGLPGDLYWRLPARSLLEGHFVCRPIRSGDPVETSNVR